MKSYKMQHQNSVIHLAYLLNRISATNVLEQEFKDNYLYSEILMFL